jgi:Tol biopolymer transport system component
MISDDLGGRLRDLDADHDRAAEDRAWAIVRTAHRPLARPRARHRWRLIVPAVAMVVVLGAGTFAVASPPRGSVGRWLRAAIGLSAPAHHRPLLAGLPGGGELLVNSPSGPWIVDSNGRRRYLGRYAAAAWSPHSLYVVAWAGTQLDALNPRGQRQWALSVPSGVSVARWSPDGYRIAYISGHGLWVVAGDGSGNHQLRDSTRRLSPAWQPNTGVAHRVAFVDRAGDIVLADADTGETLWRVTAPAGIRHLLWSENGTRLLATSAGRIELYSARGHRLAAETLTASQTITQATFGPRGFRVALILHQRDSDQDSVALVVATSRGIPGPPQILFSARAHLGWLNWSPDDQWLLAANASADQWIFIHARPPVRLEVVGRISDHFATHPGRGHPGFPVLAGWQAPARPPG